MEESALALAPILQEAQALPVSPESSENLRNLIFKALKHPSIFYFADLLDMPAVAALSSASPAERETHRMLEGFAFGCRVDLENDPQFAVDTLDPAVVSKLQKLTLCRYTSQNGRHLTFAHLRKAVYPPPTDDGIEDIVFEAVDAGLIDAYIDQENDLIHVQWAQTGDVRNDEIDKMLEVVKDWKLRCDQSLKALQYAVHQTLSAAKAAEVSKSSGENKFMRCVHQTLMHSLRPGGTCDEHAMQQMCRKQNNLRSAEGQLTRAAGRSREHPSACTMKRPRCAK